MANVEQVEILKQGDQIWNEWRGHNLDVKINLRGANLSGANLREVNLFDANLNRVNLSRADLRRANLSGANLSGVILSEGSLRGANLVEANLVTANLSRVDLSGANLHGANLVEVVLVGANLFEADLSGANLRGAVLFNTNLRKTNLFEVDLSEANLVKADLVDVNLFEVNLRGADLSGADLREVNLRGANLRGANLSGVNLVETDLVEVNLFGADLSRADLHGANLHGANLRGVNLRGANLSGTDLREVNLLGTRLISTILSNATLTGAKLYGTARDDWQIDGITCDYIFWDIEGKQRSPSDRDFRPGEFEELYKQLPTFEYIFQQGFTPLDAVVMDRVVQAINEQHKEFQLELVNFDKRGQPHATFTVCQMEFKEAAQQQVVAGYEAHRVLPENQAPLMKAILGLIGNQSKSLDIIKQLGGSTMGDTYNIQGQIGAVGKGAIATGNTFQQITTDLSRLHEHMAANAETPEQQVAADDVAKAEQAAHEHDEPTMRQHLKKAGQWALGCAKEIGTDVAAEYLKKVTLGL